ncbi:hypothetical protein TSAR_012230, partial [Trichomalopsis sarcophagae]
SGVSNKVGERSTSFKRPAQREGPEKTYGAPRTRCWTKLSSGSRNSPTPARAATKGQLLARIKAKTSQPKTGLTTSVRTEGFTFNKQSTTATSILGRKKNYHQGSTTGGHPEE